MTIPSKYRRQQQLIESYEKGEPANLSHATFLGLLAGYTMDFDDSIAIGEVRKLTAIRLVHEIPDTADWLAGEATDIAEEIRQYKEYRESKEYKTGGDM